MSTTSQIAQTLKRMPGVIMESGFSYNTDGTRYGAKVFRLSHPEEFLEWVDELATGSVRV